jgi:phage host-nuclease inhibitor protein Gam
MANLPWAMFLAINYQLSTVNGGQMAKTKVEKLKSWEVATEKLALYHEAVCAYDKKRAALAESLRKVEASYQVDIDGLATEVNGYAAELRDFADDHRKDFVSVQEGGEGRTRFSHGVEIGFRWGKPYLHIPKKFMDAAIAGLEAISADTYVKRDPKVMKEVLKAEMERASFAPNGDPNGGGPKFIARMNALHITLDQDEEFVLEVTSAL